MTNDAMDTMDCPVCGGDGFLACDDGSEVQCDRCNGTGRVPVAGDESGAVNHPSISCTRNDTAMRPWA